MIPKDALWKGIIEDLIDDFLAFFYPEIIDDIDFEKGITFLDKELEKLFPQAETSNRRADKLFRVYFKNEIEYWFLIHVEVQGYSDPNFPARMFQSAYRIRERYQKPLSALAIYTNEERKYHFTEYKEQFLKTAFIYRFQAFILVDHTPSDLQQSGNLFGWVLEVALRELLLKKKTDAQRLDSKTDLVRHLFNKGVTKDKIRKLLVFLRFYIRFDTEDFFVKFEKEIDSLTKSRKAMGIEEAILHAVEEQGFAKGEEQGFAKGEEHGYARGEEDGFLKGMKAVVIRAFQKGLSFVEIADLTELSMEEITQIINESTEGQQHSDEEE